VDSRCFPRGHSWCFQCKVVLAKEALKALPKLAVAVPPKRALDHWTGDGKGSTQGASQDSSCGASQESTGSLDRCWQRKHLRRFPRQQLRCLLREDQGNFSIGRNTSRESSRCFLREYSRASNQCLMNAITCVPYFSLF